jgi:hypothetical protein
MTTLGKWAKATGNQSLTKVRQKYLPEVKV